MIKTQKSTAPKWLALPLLAGLAFLTSMSPASAGPDAPTARHNYFMSCVDGHGYVSVYAPGGISNGYATFACEGTWTASGVV